jgi:hypothetical protein
MLHWQRTIGTQLIPMGALMLAPNIILLDCPWSTILSVSRNRPSPMPTGDAAQSTHPRARRANVLFRHTIAFGILQTMSRRLYGLSGLKLLLPDCGHRIYSVCATCLAGQGDEARETMKRYLNDNAPIRTMSQWRARFEGIPLPSYSPRPLARRLIWGRNFTWGLRKAGLPD